MEHINPSNPSQQKFETFQEYEERKWKKELQPHLTPEKAIMEPELPVKTGGKVAIILHWNNGTFCLACNTSDVDNYIFKHGSPDKIVVMEHPEMDGRVYKEIKDVSDTVSNGDQQCSKPYQNESCDYGRDKSQCIYGKSCLGDCFLQRRS